MDERMKGVLRCAVVLFAVAASVALLLATVNMLTAGAIARNEAAAEQAALFEVMPGAESFEELNIEDILGDGVEKVYAASGADGESVGCCVKIAQNGYGGIIGAVVGVGSDGKVTGVSVISHAETPGLGANIEKESFRQQYIGQKSVSVVKSGAKAGEINAVTGATVSSKALSEGVNKAVEAASHVKKSTISPVRDDTGGEEAEAYDD